MIRFYMNNREWKVIFVDPLDSILIDRSGRYTVATTDPVTNTVSISNELTGEFLVRVLIHELGHCALVSFYLLDDVHRMTYPRYWVEVEEWICNLIADYGLEIFMTAYEILGESAIMVVPYELERFITRRN